MIKSGSTGSVEVSGEGLGGFGAEKVPEKVREALQSQVKFNSQVRFNRDPKKVPEKVWEALVQSQVRINRFREVSGEGLGGFVAEKVPGEGPGGFAEPGQVQQVPEKARSGSTGFRRRFRRRSGRLWCRVRSGSTGSEKFLEKVWEALLQSKVSFNRVPEKVPEKVWEGVPKKVL